MGKSLSHETRSNILKENNKFRQFPKFQKSEKNQKNESIFYREQLLKE